MLRAFAGVRVARVVVVVGMKRSGNHAISSWLLPQDDFLYFNNVLPMRPILTGRMQIPPPMRRARFLRWQLARRRHRSSARWPLAVESMRLRRRPLLVGLEDHPPERRLFARERGVIHALVLRDPENMLASRIRKAFQIDPNPAYPREPGPLLDRIVHAWKAHAREYLGATRHLDDKVCIDYATWVASQAYRRSLSEALGLRFDDSGFARVSPIGGGSSFDGTRFDGAGAAMNVLRRAEQLRPEERTVLDAALADAELRDLAHACADVRAQLAARYATASSQA